MSDALASIRLTCYVTIVLCGPEEASAVDFLEKAHAVAVAGLSFAPPEARALPQRLEISDSVADAIAAHESLFRVLFW